MLVLGVDPNFTLGDFWDKVGLGADPISACGGFCDWTYLEVDPGRGWIGALRFLSCDPTIPWSSTAGALMVPFQQGKTTQRET